MNEFHHDPELDQAVGDYSYGGAAFNDVHRACTKWLEARGLAHGFMHYGEVKKATRGMGDTETRGTEAEGGI